jgi:hypothetical protein
MERCERLHAIEREGQLNGRAHKMPRRNAALTLGLVSTGVAAADQATSVVRTRPGGTHARTRPGGTHADRTVVAVVAVGVPPMMNVAVCKCKRALERQHRGQCYCRKLHELHGRSSLV